MSPRFCCLVRFRRGGQKREYPEPDGHQSLEVRFQNAKHVEDVGIPALGDLWFACIVLR